MDQKLPEDIVKNICEEYGLTPDSLSITVRSYYDMLIGSQLTIFREQLGLTIHEFAVMFDINEKLVENVENVKSIGRIARKFFEVLFHFPEVALYLLHESDGFYGWGEKGEKVISTLRDMLDKRRIKNAPHPCGTSSIKIVLDRDDRWVAYFEEWVSFFGESEGYDREFPEISASGATPEEALRNVQEVWCKKKLPTHVNL